MNGRHHHGVSAAVLAIMAAVLCPRFARAQSISSAAAGLVETGVPPFVIESSANLGLNAEPTDLHLMPDGRVLVFAPRQIALGDGVRWQVYRQSATDPVATGDGCVVDSDGRIYVGTGNGAARVVFGEDGFWRLAPVESWDTAKAGGVNLPQSVVTETPRDWIWHSLTGPLITWRPGHQPQVIGQAETFEDVFELGDSIFLSERFGGRISRLNGGAKETIIDQDTLAAVTCTQPFGDNQVIVGTYGLGLQLFDGHALGGFRNEGVLSSGARINDLCTTAAGMFAVAIDNFGIVFITHDGQIIQSLSRTLDQRLARVRRLLPAAGGAIWGLLDDGIVRVEFPSRVTNFEPLIGAGITTVHPYRVDGRLWLLVDGRVYHAEYDSAGLLQSLERDSPERKFVSSFSSATHVPVVGTQEGAYYRTNAGWMEFAPSSKNLRILDPVPNEGRWLFMADDEVGWLTRDHDAFSIAERFPVRGLTNSFNNPVRDARGQIWLELGTGRLARVQLDNGKPGVTIFSAAQGVPPTWPQIFPINGIVYFNFGNRVFRFDEAHQRFEADDEFIRRLPGVTTFFGRPGVDAFGRLWITADGVVQIFEQRNGQWQRSPLNVTVGFQPYYFTFESNGVVWMHAQRRFARFDPAMAESKIEPLRAMITDVVLTATDRHLFAVDHKLPPLDYAENSLVVHYVAGGDPLALPTTFEFKLEGSGEDWVTTGNTGSAAFNRLAEGNYILHIRPRSGATLGGETTLAFFIRPPWSRTTLAYVVYAVSSVALVLIAIAAWTLLARREKVRLERLVLARTTQLGRSEARYRALNAELELRVEARTAELHHANTQLQETNRELEAFSYSISHDLRAPLRNIRGFADLLFRRVRGTLDNESGRFLGVISTEATRLGQLIDSLLGFSRLSRAELNRGRINLNALIDAVRTELASECADRDIQWKIDPLPPAHGDPTLLRQVFANLMGNAVKFTQNISPALIEIGYKPDTQNPRNPIFYIRDNGVGFDPDHAGKLFGVFQRLHSVKDFSGTGIGLAIVRRIVARHGGHVWAEGSPGAGATFYFTLSADAATTEPPESSDAATP